MEIDKAAPIRIDLNQFKLHIKMPGKFDVSLHFTSPSRRFYLSVIALLVQEMKRLGRITSIPIDRHHPILALLNETVGGAAGSSKSEHLMPRIYRKWKDALPDLKHAPLFRVLGRSKEYEDAVGKTYSFTDEEKDIWANLFEYKGSREHVRLRFSLDSLGATLEDVTILYGDDPKLSDTDAWTEFVGSLMRQIKGGNESRYPNRGNFFFRVLPSDREVLETSESLLSLPEKPSIAVLPFVNISGDPEQEYFSDGLTEEIITALSKIPRLFVIASHSTFFYKGRKVKIPHVAEELGVRYVLEGSVRKSEDRVRITAQLIDALKGHHLWSERYDRTVKDIFFLQDDITKNIIISLQLKMMPGEKLAIYAKGTENLDAYLKALEGISLLREVTREGMFRCQQLAEEAIVLDSDYAYAYYLLGIAHVNMLWYGLSQTPKESLRIATEAGMKAITLDNSLAVAHAGLGYTLILARKYDEALSAGEMAVSLEPNSAEVLNRYACILMFAGENEKAITIFKKALRLNPKPSNHLYRHYGNALANVGRYEEAIYYQKKAIEQNSNDIFAYMVMASVCSMAGREAEARAAAKEVLKINPDFSVARVRLIRPDKDRAIAKLWCDTLRKAGLPD